MGAKPLNAFQNQVAYQFDPQGERWPIFDLGKEPIPVFMGLQLASFLKSPRHAAEKWF
jgi:hypothetical protein